MQVKGSHDGVIPQKIILRKIFIYCLGKFKHMMELLGLEPPSHEEERKTKEDLEDVNYERGTERRKDVEGGEEVGSRQKSLEKLRISPLLLHRR
jgi:hypothetical protein